MWGEGSGSWGEEARGRVVVTGWEGEEEEREGEEEEKGWGLGRGGG